MGSRIEQYTADTPAGSCIVMIFAGFIFVILSLSALAAMALSFKTFLTA